MPLMFMLPFRAAFDSNNRTVPGAQAYFTLAGTNTKTPAYTAADMATPLPNPLIADGVGRFPKAYLNASLSYRLRIYEADAEVAVDTPVEEYDPYIPGSVVVGSEFIEPYATSAAGSATSAAASAASASSSATAASTAATAAVQAEAAAEAAAAIVSSITDDFAFDTSGVNIPVTSRSILASLPTSIPAYLDEAGREGNFVFDSSNLSAQVAVDPQQGIYVAPSSDTTGASGAWVRKFSGPVNAKWFGATGDGTTDDHTALQAWLDRGGDLYLPAGEYYSSAKLILRKCAVINGSDYGFDARTVDGTSTTGYENQPGAKIKFPAAIGGLDIQPQTTVTDVATAVAAGTGGYTQEGAMHSRISNLALVGAGTGASATGLYCRTVVHLDNVHIFKFQGKGFDFSASSDIADGNSEFGLADLSTLSNCRAIQNGSHGFHLRGRDVNGCVLTNCWSQLNGGWGFLDESVNGNTYIGGQAATNTSGSYKCVGAVANSGYYGCYVEADSGKAPDIGKRSAIHGGYLADITYQYNVGTNGNPEIITASGTFTGKTTFVDNQTSGAVSLKGNVYRHANNGLVLQGAPNGGGAYDVSIVNKSDAVVMQVPTGTVNARFAGQIYTVSDILINGNIGWGGIISGQANLICHVNNGLMMGGYGAVYDVTLVNRAGTNVLQIPTNTTNVVLAGNLTAVPAASATPASNGQMTFELTSNTTLKVKVKGSDGVVRSVSLTLA